MDVSEDWLVPALPKFWRNVGADVAAAVALCLAPPQLPTLHFHGLDELNVTCFQTNG